VASTSAAGKVDEADTLDEVETAGALAQAVTNNPNEISIIQENKPIFFNIFFPYTQINWKLEYQNPSSRGGFSKIRNKFKSPKLIRPGGQNQPGNKKLG
jgi:hypothetical protein